jgi:hypothetical protein
MRVTKDMKVEFGTTRLIDYADVLGTDEVTGAQVTVDRDEVRLVVDPLSTDSLYIDMDPDTAEDLGLLLIQRAAEARA